MEDLALKISKYVKEVRKEKSLSISDVVRRCNLSRSYVNMIEAGKNPKTDKAIAPSLDTIAELCKGLDVDKSEFLTKVGFIDTRANEPLLNYKMALEELMTYKAAINNINIDHIAPELRYQMFKEIDQFLDFQIYRLERENDES